VIARVNEFFVPVWINVRDNPFPNMPGMEGAAAEFDLGADRRLKGGFSYHFHARTYAVSPDGNRVLAMAKATTQAGSMLKLLDESLSQVSVR